MTPKHSVLPMADPSPRNGAPAVQLDSRKAVWFPETRTLAVADLHLGYAWVGRRRGQLLPLTAPDDAAGRLGELVASYQPRSVIIVGDLVHAGLPMPAIESELKSLMQAVRSAGSVRLVLGNHDRDLPRLLAAWSIPITSCRVWREGGVRFCHGDADPAPLDGFRDPVLLEVLGHEHPSITLGDGVASSVRCPCFMIGDGLLLLPAFSQWAAGSEIRPGRFMGPVASRGSFHEACVCMGTRLLRLPLAGAAVGAAGRRRGAGPHSGDS